VRWDIRLHGLDPVIGILGCDFMEVFNKKIMRDELIQVIMPGSVINDMLQRDSGG
jgi:hypothetical protein